MLKVESSWQPPVELSEKQKNCPHEWQFNEDVPQGSEQCTFCKFMTNPNMRIHCALCLITGCPMCSNFYIKIKVNPKTQGPKVFTGKDTLIRELLQYIDYLLAENERLQKQVDELKLEHLEKEFQEMVIEEKKRKEKGKG